MKKQTIVALILGAMVLGAGLAGCSGPSDIKQGSPLQSIWGVAAVGAPIDGTVTLKDSSMPPRTKVARTTTGGDFTFQVDATYQPPFTLRADYQADQASLNGPSFSGERQADRTSRRSLYSYAEGTGRTNINPFSHLTYATASGAHDSSEVTDNLDSTGRRSLHDNYSSVKKKLMRKLAPLFAQYGTGQDPVNDEYEADHMGMDALFDAVSITIAGGTITVTNKETGGVIFSAPVDNIDAGTFYPENMPGGSGTGTTDGAALYATYCESCHGPLATSSKLGASVSRIQSAIGSVGAMDELSLTSAQIQAIADALATEPTPTPTTPDGAALYATYCESCHGPLATSSKLGQSASVIQSAIDSVGAMRQLSSLTSAQIQAIADALATTAPEACTYTYSAWGDCQTNNTRTRTMLTSSPDGCTGTPLLSQSCTYVPPDCTYTYSAWGDCQSDGTQTRTMLTASPAGCSGTPLLSQSCAYVPPTPTSCTYTYSAWGTCQSDGTQTRTVQSSSPAGCTGTPVLSQSCTYVPPACTYTYSGWGTCQPDGTQTRTVQSSSPAGCTGTPALSQSCTYVPPAPVLTNADITSACTTCHGLTVNTTVFRSGGYTVTGRSASQWLSTVNSMVRLGASLKSGTTAQNYADYLATVP